MSAVIAEPTTLMPVNPLVDHFRCPRLPSFATGSNPGGSTGFFQFGDGAVCYGQVAGAVSVPASGQMFDASKHVASGDGTIFLPFDVRQSIDNLRYERYVSGAAGHRWMEQSWVKDIYYRLRPMMPVSLRKHLQKIYLRGWESIPFPNWPVDRSFDILLEKLLIVAMKQMQVDRVPFIWFWPDGHKACAIMTHDVETASGRDFCERLMDIDDEFGIKASFQIVPEKRYSVTESFLEMIRRREYEINVQGLDHDGNLFAHREEFLKRARQINKYANQWGAVGFRSPILYRNIDWFQDLDFQYDMSIPNVARVEAQRGGCCTVMPYVLPGGITELPVTVSEDYTLFHILNDYSITLWKRQAEIIVSGYGLVNFIIHPDYVMPSRAQDVYKTLLEHLRQLRSEQNLWITLPGEVDRWWRQRNEMKLVAGKQNWVIEGPGSDRAKVAWARVDGDRLVYQTNCSA